MEAKPVALIPRCTECDAYWSPLDEDRWQARFGCDESLDGPGELFFYCPECAEREFGESSYSEPEPAGCQPRGIVIGLQAHPRG